jgi:hypothetical protein
VYSNIIKKNIEYRMAEIQSVLIPKSKFTLIKAKKWIRNNGYRLTFHGKKVDITNNYYRFRQKSPSGTMRTITSGDIKFIIMY